MFRYTRVYDIIYSKKILINCRYPLRELTELRPFRSTEFQKIYKHEP